MYDIIHMFILQYLYNILQFYRSNFLCVPKQLVPQKYEYTSVIPKYVMISSVPLECCNMNFSFIYQSYFFMALLKYKQIDNLINVLAMQD